MPAFEAVEGMPYWIDLATSQPLKSTYFYSRLLGWDISEDAYRIARKEGLPVAGFIPQRDGATATDTWVAYFFTRDLARDRAAVERLGGTVLASSEVALGEMSLCADPSGAMFGLIRPAGEEQFIAAGEPGTAVWHEYVAAGSAKECIDFYGELLDWEIRYSADYYIALRDGAPFLGLRDLSGDERFRDMAGYWDVFLGVPDVAAAASGVQGLGGTVTAGPAASPFGPLLFAADATGAKLTLCEVEEPAPEEFSEADSILDL